MINAIVAIGKVDWEAGFVSGLAHPVTGVQVQRRCVDAVDVLAVVKVLTCDAVIISDHTMRIDAEFVSELNRLKIRVIALTNNKKFFEDLGYVECVALDAANPLSSVSVIASLVRLNKQEPVEAPQLIGELIFVGGFGGGTGKTRLALEISAQLANQNQKILLVDGDSYGPSIRQYLGLPIEATGLLEVCRQIERRNLINNSIEPSAILVSPNLFVLPGLIKNSRWVDLRQSALKGLWERALAEFDYVVVDGGPVFEPEPAISIETGLPKRNLISTTALDFAEKIVITARQDAASITRLIKGLIEFQNLFQDKQVVAAVSGPTEKRDRKEIVSAIRQNTEVSHVEVLDFAIDEIKKVEKENSLIALEHKQSALGSQYELIAKSLTAVISNNSANNRLKKLLPKNKNSQVA